MMRLSCAAFAALGLVGPVWAQTLSTSDRGALLRSQLNVLDGRAAQQYAGSSRLEPPRIEIPQTAAAYTGTYRGPFLDFARAAANRHDIPADLFLRLVQQESAWNPRAESRAGAQGLAQLMPVTARQLGVSDPWDPRQNLDGGARYLSHQFRTFGRWDLALAAYNAGPEAVRRHGGVPPYAETEHYVKVVLGR